MNSGLIRRKAVVALAGASLPAIAGINWKTVWMEPNPAVLTAPGATLPYRVYGIHGADGKAELTRNPHLRIVSSDPTIVAVNREEAVLVAKSAGEVELRISFSEATSVLRVSVRSRE